MTRASALAAGLLAALAALVGCVGKQTADTTSSTSRSQAADDVSELDAFATVGAKTAVGNVEPISVSGVGLVYGLRGTGSSPAHDNYRSMLEVALRRTKGSPKELLDDPSKSTSLVLISAVLPAGARVGDKLDVAVTLPPGSKTTSLKDGILWSADLQNFEMAAAARDSLQKSGIPVGKVPQASGGTILPGHRLAVAEGPLVAGREGKTGDEGDGPRAARIWGGAKCMLDRPYYLLLNDSAPQPRLAMVIAERMNAVFHAPGDSLGKLAEAKVQGRPLVIASVPPGYRLNHGRFLLVARQVPLSPITSDSPYRKQLEVDLLRPETALLAALKLEALGADSRQPLRVGLQSDSPWVRFAAAESLAYLGHADGAKDLAELAATHPAVRAQALTALASLDDAICLDQLAELMKKPDPQLRYGAFVALRLADEKHTAIRGTKINDSYWLHQVAPEATPGVYVTTDRRAEIVLYGARLPLAGPFTFALGKEFTISAKEGEPVVTVTKYGTKDGEPVAVPMKVLADVAAVLTAMGEMGGTYAEAVEFISRADKADVMLCSVQYDAMPKSLSVQQLAQIASSDPSLERADLEVTRAGEKADVAQASYDLPSASEGVKATPAPTSTAPPPNQNPGKIWGPKDGRDLSREQGRIFGSSPKK